MVKTAFAISFACALLSAQANDQQFEVASVKPAVHRASRGTAIDGGPGTAKPGQISYNDLSLSFLLQRAFDTHPFQIDFPAWMNEESFDIVAKVPPGKTKADVRVMLANLLVDRFHIKIAHVSRETSAYVLAVGKKGSKMTAYPMTLPEDVVETTPRVFAGYDANGFLKVPPGFAAGAFPTTDGVTRVSYAMSPLRILCNIISGNLKRPVVDQTGLTGRYDFRLAFAADTAATQPASEGGGDPSPQASEPAPTLFNAVQKQLGLKLESKRLPVDFVVVEQADRKPIEN